KVTRGDDFVAAELTPSVFEITPEMRVAPKLVGPASAFDITGPMLPHLSSWRWDVTAKAIGNRRSLTLEFPSAAKFDFKFENTRTSKVVTRAIPSLPAWIFARSLGSLRHSVLS